MIQRRHFIRNSVLTAVPAFSAPFFMNRTLGAEMPFDDECGVASGDPHPDGFVLWGRLPRHARKSGQDNYEVFYEVSKTPFFEPQSRVALGQLWALAQNDFTLKARVRGLEPKTTYYYRFFNDSPYESTIGRSKTTPRPDDQNAVIKIGLVTCQRFSDGFYSAYENLAAEDLDAVIHLGDHIYEKENGRPWKLDPLGGKTAKELSDYRAKYRYYLSDPAYQKVRRLFPWIDIWDDHEVMNDYAGSVDRKAHKELFYAGYKAFSEYMPFETDLTQDQAAAPTMPIHRALTFGSRLEILATDLRQYRSPHPGYFGNRRHASDRTMFGTEQKAWLKDKLAQSICQWKLLTSEVMMTPLRIGLRNSQSENFAHQIFGDFKGEDRGFYINLDQWDGFPAERAELLEFIANEKIQNVLVCAGDIHASFHSLLYKDSEQVYGPAEAVEVVTPSISSTTLGQVFGKGLTPILESSLRQMNPQIIQSNITHNGYTVLTFGPEGTQVRTMLIQSPWTSHSKVKEHTPKWIPHGKSILV